MRRGAAIALAIGAVATAARAEPAPGWELRVPDKLEVAAGAVVTLPIALAVDRGLTVSRDAGMIVDLAPEPGLTIKRQRLGRGEAVDPEADAPRFAVPVRAEAAGEHAVALHLQFWLCGQRACRPIDLRRRVVVTVTPATAPPLDH